jgi:hypothetical protein
MNFIKEFELSDLEICDSLIAFYNSNKQKTFPGCFVSSQGIVIDKSKKDSCDLLITDEEYLQNPCIKKYLKELNTCMEAYKKEYPFCNSVQRWGISEPFRIQFYKPNGGYKVFHTERFNNVSPYCNRHLVFMTYLNTVTEGGETEFFHQALKINAVKGKTVIWPADWTHTHRGIVSETQEKYIVTGWYSFY